VGVSPDATVDNFAILAAVSGKAAESAATGFSPDELAQLERVAETLEGVRVRRSDDPMPTRSSIGSSTRPPGRSSCCHSSVRRCASCRSIS